MAGVLTPVFLKGSPLSPINDNYLGGPTIKLVHQIQLVPQCQDKSVSANINLDKFQTVNKVPWFKPESRRAVYCPVVSPVRSVLSHGHPQKKGVSPGNCLNKIKSVKSVFCVDPCVFAPIVPSVPSAVSEHNVGGRLQEFWQVWQTMGSNPRVVSILKRGYTLPFKQRPVLTRFPVVQSGYANPSKNMHLKEALVSLMRKLVVERVVVKSSLAFYNHLFLVPKPNGKWRPILDLSRLNLFLSTGTFKMETPETIRLSLQTGEWVTSLDFSDAYFHIPIAPRSRKYLRFFLFQQTFQFTALPFGLATAPLEFIKVVKEVKLMAQARGIRIHQYLDDWLLRAPSPEICLQHTQTLLDLCRELGWVVNMAKSELVPSQVFNFVGYRFDLISGRVLPTQEKLRFIKSLPRCTVRQFMSLIGLLTATEKQVSSGRLHMRPLQWHLKRHWHVPEVLEKVIPVPQSLHPHLDWWLDENNVLNGQLLHPLQHAVQLFTDASNEGWGAHLGDFTARGVWSPLEGRLHINFLEMKAVLLALRQLEHLCKDQIVLVATDNTTVVSYINKQGGMRSDSLCALLWRLLSWCHHRGITLRARHIPGRLNVIADKLSRHNQVIQTEWALSPQVFSQLCSRWPPPLVDLFATRFNYKFPGSLGSRRPELVLGTSKRLSVPSSLPAPSGSFEDKRPGLSQDDSDCPRLAKHALVLGPGGPIRSDPIHPPSDKGPSDSTIQRVSSPEPSESQSSCLAPRSCTIRKHGFSEEVAARIEAPQRGSTRAVYKSKWTIFVKWCKSNQVDVRSPSVNQIADFLLYLFKERNLQPSTIDGYRTAIADMVGNDKLNVSSDENLTRLLDSFHRDKPKGRRGVPSWNLSLVLHQLTKAPFEPLRKASLKHLTFKTVFLLALGSGKRRSEIHAWLAKNIRHQEDWSKVSLYPSPSFLSKNQLARDGPASVAPVVIPALAPTLDKSLSGDRSLCPVRALRYYLDRTKDSRQGKELVFVSFKTGFQKDIVPATISSWVKQTVLLCYQLSDQKAQDVHQVRAHDVRAFAASRAFQGGISLDQILSACHWKAHNTFTQFYLKDLAWADSELYHLGPVVAAQQIQDT